MSGGTAVGRAVALTATIILLAAGALVAIAFFEVYLIFSTQRSCLSAHWGSTEVACLLSAGICTRSASVARHKGCSYFHPRILAFVFMSRRAIFAVRCDLVSVRVLSRIRNLRQSFMGKHIMPMDSSW
jgi:hypothetical protein